jgi:hypothetical protein
MRMLSLTTPAPPPRPLVAIDRGESKELIRARRPGDVQAAAAPSRIRSDLVARRAVQLEKLGDAAALVFSFREGLTRPLAFPCAGPRCGPAVFGRSLPAEWDPLGALGARVMICPTIAGAGPLGLAATRKHECDTTEDNDFCCRPDSRVLIAGRRDAVWILP